MERIPGRLVYKILTLVYKKKKLVHSSWKEVSMLRDGSDWEWQGSGGAGLLLLSALWMH